MLSKYFKTILHTPQAPNPQSTPNSPIEKIEAARDTATLSIPIFLFLQKGGKAGWVPPFVCQENYPFPVHVHGAHLSMHELRWSVRERKRGGKRKKIENFWRSSLGTSIVVKRRIKRQHAIFFLKKCKNFPKKGFFKMSSNSSTLAIRYGARMVFPLPPIAPWGY